MGLADRIAVMDRGRSCRSARRREIYERPATRFVADFVGRANLFEGVRRAGRRGGAPLLTRAPRTAQRAASPPRRRSRRAPPSGSRVRARATAAWTRAGQSATASRRRGARARHSCGDRARGVARRPSGVESARLRCRSGERRARAARSRDVGIGVGSRPTHGTRARAMKRRVQAARLAPRAGRSLPPFAGWLALFLLPFAIVAGDQPGRAAPTPCRPIASPLAFAGDHADCVAPAGRRRPLPRRGLLATRRASRRPRRCSASLIGYPMASRSPARRALAPALLLFAGHAAVLDPLPDPRLRLDRRCCGRAGSINRAAARAGLIDEPLPLLVQRVRGPARARLLLPAVHGAAALRQPGAARPQRWSRPRPISARRRGGPSRGSSCR